MKISLTWVLAISRLMLFITHCCNWIEYVYLLIVPKGFFPQQDTGRIIGSIQARQDISFQAMQ